jgi:hypothetical protein
LQVKDLREWTVGEKVTFLDGEILEELEGLPDGRAWVCGARRNVPSDHYYSISVSLVKDYFKWFGWCAIAGRMLNWDWEKVKGRRCKIGPRGTRQEILFVSVYSTLSPPFPPIL